MKNILGVLMCFVFVSADAALISAAGGQAVYDTDLDVTWVANANLAASNTFGVVGIDANGKMIANTALSWIGAMNAVDGTGYLGFNGWRLPTTLQPDASCSIQDEFGSRGFNCTGSEMGHLFYNELGGTAGNRATDSGDPDLALFTNIYNFSNYWSGTHAVNPSFSDWLFAFNSGNQGSGSRSSTQAVVWAVADGNIFSAAMVPVPAAVWLFGSALGLLGWVRRKAV